ncbi:MAG: hypothetical protein J6M66_10130, partial [Lachnospiraceae bacterium]|nr:hypothetical protein [Lachnospiraceae bacterium]
MIFSNKKCRNYAACGVSQTPNIIRYNEVGSSGYYLHADRILINDYSPRFIMDAKSHDPQGSLVELVMGGFMHIAAVPKAYL